MVQFSPAGNAGKAKLELEAKLAKGLQGSPTRIARKDWQAIKREALEGLTGEKLAP
jgi:hypothetical protein